MNDVHSIPVLDAKERAKAATVEELFAKIRTNPKYKDVYLITPDASDAHETSVDGTHPSSYGYALWAKLNRDSGNRNFK